MNDFLAFGSNRKKLLAGGNKELDHPGTDNYQIKILPSHVNTQECLMNKCTISGKPLL